MKASGSVSLGFHLEWRPFPRRGEPPCKVALMQLCMEKTHCYLMHIFHSGVPPILKSLLEDSSSVKVGVCIDNDARKMFNDYDVSVQPLMDLSIIANVKLAGPHRRWSLAALTEMITCNLQPPVYSCRSPATSEWETGSLRSSQNSNFSMLLLMPTSRGTCMRYCRVFQIMMLMLKRRLYREQSSSYTVMSGDSLFLCNFTS